MRMELLWHLFSLRVSGRLSDHLGSSDSQGRVCTSLKPWLNFRGVGTANSQSGCMAGPNITQFPVEYSVTLKGCTCNAAALHTDIREPSELCRHQEGVWVIAEGG